MLDSAARRWGPARATTAAKADTGTISTTHRLIAPPRSSPRRGPVRARARRRNPGRVRRSFTGSGADTLVAPCNCPTFVSATFRYWFSGRVQSISSTLSRVTATGSITTCPVSWVPPSRKSPQAAPARRACSARPCTIAVTTILSRM